MRALLSALVLLSAPLPCATFAQAAADDAEAAAPSLDALQDRPLPQLGPYEAFVPASGQSNAARNAALRDAMQSVVERLAGFGSSSSLAVQSLLDRAPQYVLSYGFEVDASTTPPQPMLRARFDGGAVNAALVDAGLIAPPQLDALSLEVSGIETLADYLRVSAYLRGLSGVSTAAPVAGFDDVVRFDMKIQGGQRELDLRLETGGLLRQLSDAGYNQPARYQLVQ